MEVIQTDSAPANIGPYSQGIRDGDTVFVSGQGPVDPETGEIIGGDIQDQTCQTLENVDAILRAAGGSLDDVCKTTVFVRDMANYNEINETYSKYFTDPFPARSAVEVSDLPVPIDIEIEAQATIPLD